MATASFRFYAELNDLLPRRCRQRELSHSFREPANLKDRIEAQGVPHTEVELILVDGRPADFGCRLRDGARVSVYPFLARLENPRPLRPPYPRGRFVLDQHLGKLAARLRMLGLDVLHRTEFPDPELARVAVAEGRVLLSRDKGLLMRRELVHGGFVHATDPMAQVPEVLHRFGAAEAYAPFSRCLACNAELQAAPAETLRARLSPSTLARYSSFRRCLSCDRVFWEGPHFRRMRGWVEAWLRHPDVVS